MLHSTVTASLEAADNLACNIDLGKDNAVAFLDLKEAFDTVDHDISYCLNYIFVVYQVLPINVFPPFLHNHTQKCLVNGSLSECCILMCGIDPQDNIRASTVFAIHQ